MNKTQSGNRRHCVSLFKEKYLAFSTKRDYGKCFLHNGASFKQTCEMYNKNMSTKFDTKTSGA